MPARIAIAAALVAALVAGLAGPAPAQSTPLLEARIAGMRPCAPLPRITELERLRVARVTVAAEGNALTARLEGSVACRSSGAPVLQARAFADVLAEATLPLSDCRRVETRVTLSNVGSATSLDAAFRTRIAEVFATRAAAIATDTCRSLAAP